MMLLACFSTFKNSTAGTGKDVILPQAYTVRFD